LLTYSVPLFLKRQCDRTLGQRAPRRPRGPARGQGGGASLRHTAMQRPMQIIRQGEEAHDNVRQRETVFFWSDGAAEPHCRC
jgi:hypothetical protein